MSELQTRNERTRSYKIKIYNARTDLSELQAIARMIACDSNLEETRRAMLLKQANASIDALLDQWEIDLQNL